VLEKRIASAIFMANGELQEARIGAGKGHADINVNRREKRDDRIVLGTNPGGAIDYEVGVIRIDDAERRPICTIVNYACHPVVLGGSNYLLPPGSRLEEPMRATLSYLLSTYAGPTSPDLVIILRENTLLAKWPEGSHGLHGEITWGAQHIVLTIYGPGIEEGRVSDYPARLVDIVPTIASLMGLTHHSWDGIVLADALKSPSPEELALQEEKQREVGPLAYALCAQLALDRGVPATECESINR